MINVRETITVNTRPKARSFKCYATQVGVGGINFSGKKHYKGVRFNVIILALRGGPISRKKSVRPTDTYPNPRPNPCHDAEP